MTVVSLLLLAAFAGGLLVLLRGSQAAPAATPDRAARARYPTPTPAPLPPAVATQLQTLGSAPAAAGPVPTPAPRRGGMGDKQQSIEVCYDPFRISWHEAPPGTRALRIRLHYVGSGERFSYLLPPDRRSFTFPFDARHRGGGSPAMCMRHKDFFLEVYALTLAGEQGVAGIAAQGECDLRGARPAEVETLGPAGAAGNIGTPDTIEPTTVRGVAAQLMAGPGADRLVVTWQEGSRQGQPLTYRVLASGPGREELLHLVENLVPVAIDPGQVPPAPPRAWPVPPVWAAVVLLPLALLAFAVLLLGCSRRRSRSRLRSEAAAVGRPERLWTASVEFR